MSLIKKFRIGRVTSTRSAEIQQISDLYLGHYEISCLMTILLISFSRSNVNLNLNTYQSQTRPIQQEFGQYDSTDIDYHYENTVKII